MIEKMLQPIYLYYKKIDIIALAGIRERYSRSVLGQWWIVVQGFVLNLFVGLLWANLWGQEIRTFLPYLAFGSTLYTSFSNSISESTSCFQEFSRYILSSKIHFSILIISVMYRNFILLLHNLLAVLILFFYFDTSINLSALPFFNIAIVLLTIYFYSYFLAYVCARFRDLKQIVIAVLSVLFLLTPVMWTLEQANSFKHLILLNPFASFLNITRDYMLSMPVYALAYQVTYFYLVVGMVLSCIVYKYYGKKIIYWI